MNIFLKKIITIVIDRWIHVTSINVVVAAFALQIAMPKKAIHAVAKSERVGNIASKVRDLHSRAIPSLVHSFFTNTHFHTMRNYKKKINHNCEK